MELNNYKDITRNVLALIRFSSEGTSSFWRGLTLTSVVLETPAFWALTPCRLVNIHRRFEGSYCLQLHEQSSIMLSPVDKVNDTRRLEPTYNLFSFDVRGLEL